MANRKPLRLGGRFVEDVGKRGFPVKVGLEVHGTFTGAKTDDGFPLYGIHSGGQHLSTVFPCEGERCRLRGRFWQKPDLLTIPGMQGEEKIPTIVVPPFRRCVFWNPGNVALFHPPTIGMVYEKCSRACEMGFDNLLTDNH